MTHGSEAGLLRLATALTEHLGHDMHVDDEASVPSGRWPAAGPLR
ncbi:hypothetical protein ACFV8T_38510 [Streptomyces sp. NPDC059832]